MNASRTFRVVVLLLAAAFFSAPTPAVACAACFGASDSAMAQGMNWGILSLLAVVVSVLGAIASFFIYLAKKSALAAAATTPAQVPEASTKV